MQTLRARDLMTPDPVTCDASTTITDAARIMRDQDIGDVLVAVRGELRGIVTDRDIVIRGLAGTTDPAELCLADVCTDDLVTVDADADIDEVIELMETHALRRVPVMDGNEPIGIVSIGDVAVEHDVDGALGEISSAPPDQ